MGEIKLNSEQKQAVEFENGPLLIIAGAGTGKTTVITERVKWLIINQKIKSSEILALTFTEKAANQMQERVDISMPYGYTQMWISTFHSFCDRILRDEAINIGLDPGYRLMSEAESTKLLKDNLFKLDLNYFRPLGNPTKFITSMLVHFSRLKDEDVSPEQYLDWVKNQESRIKNQGKEEEKINGEKYLELARAYKEYEELKVKEGKMDFADLITNALKLFRLRKNILNEYQQKFKYVLIDEFQDTNIAQYELVKLLAPAKNNPNLTIVADDNQSIYRFRGAAVSNILFFKKDYPEAKTIILNKNYRSTQQILDSSYKLIKNNDPDTLEARLGISKKLSSERKIKGQKPALIYEDRVEDEADQVVEKIQEIYDSEKYQWSDFAILVRANNHAEPFIRALARKNIPYQFLGPGMLYKQVEIKELIAYLKTLNNPFDSLSLYKVLAMELFMIPGRDLASIMVYGKRYNLSLLETLEKIVFKDLPLFFSAETKEKINKIVKMIHRHLDLVAKETAGQILYYFLEDSGYLRKFTNFTSQKEEKKAQNISQFFEKLKTYEVEYEDASIGSVCDWIDFSLQLGESPLATNSDWSENNAVNILTTHSSKGLEFPIVFLVNLVSQRFPTIERREKIPIPEKLIKEVLPEGDYHLEEERRLFYVGMTRTRDLLFLTAANFYGEGKRTKQLSPFIYETLGEEAVKKNKKENIKDNQLSLFTWEKTPEVVLPKKTLKVSYLSYSQIQTFKMCPLHYKLRYILKIPTPTTAALSFGTTIHATMRDFYEYAALGEKPSLEKLLVFYENNWLVEGYSSKKHETLTREKGQKYLETYFQKSFNFDRLPAGLEIPFKFPVSPTLHFGGRFDRVDRLNERRIEIIDYKTGEKVPSQKDVDKDLQMTLYALAATQIRDQLFWKKPEEIILSLYYFNEQVKISTTRTKEQLLAAKEEVIKIAEEIENSDFQCKGNEFCRTCEYNLYCEVR